MFVLKGVKHSRQVIQTAAGSGLKLCRFPCRIMPGVISTLSCRSLLNNIHLSGTTFTWLYPVEIKTFILAVNPPIAFSVWSDNMMIRARSGQMISAED
jgi:hypothetical protein